ncbi:MAG: molybdenum cofactor biosynthesis protein MoaE [Candidatus Nanopelagicaceae bacterium]
MSTDIQVTTSLTHDPISTSLLVEEIASHDSGAVVTFSGNVRDHDHGKSVESLRYEIHPSTSLVLAETVKEVALRHDLNAVAVTHRYGEIPIGATAFAVAVAAAHRGAAFAACTELVDEVKAKLPIWKHQVFTDGTDEWVNSA